MNLGLENGEASDSLIQRVATEFGRNEALDVRFGRCFDQEKLGGDGGVQDKLGGDGDVAEGRDQGFLAFKRIGERV